MTKYRSAIFSALVFVCALGLVSSAQAQTPVLSHKAYITFSRQFEIPGRILPPGTYVFRLIVPEIHVGQVLNADETEVLGIFFTTTVDRRSGGKLESDVRLEPREKGSVKWDRIIAWFSPGETIGDALSYDKYKPVEPAVHR